MRRLPLSLGIIHFVGIGGIGMSGIAEVLHTLGYTIRGSDINEGPNVLRLRSMGIPVTVGHAAENIGPAQVVVVSSAVATDNPEVVAARDNLVPVVRRAEMLSELMRLKWSIAVGGTHGKTTTTSIIAALLDSAGMDPTVINGGIINAWGSNARLGSGDWMVAEADESDGSFLKLPATVAVVTNIDPEHMEYYGSLERLHQAFDTFVENIPFYGFAALCIDHPEVQSMIPRVSDRRIVTYGFSPQADLRAANVRTSSGGSSFDVFVKGRKTSNGRVIEGLQLPMIGDHNVQNALAAVAIATEMNVDDNVVRRGLSNFAGVKRRFTQTGNADGVVVIDDYGHHPVEISAVLKAARASVCGKVIAVVQPHRYTRLRDLFEEFCTCFNDADVVIVADVYAAGEIPIKGFDKCSLIEGLRHHGHRAVEALEGPEYLADLVGDLAVAGDMVVCLGAGNITQWANELPSQLLAQGQVRKEVANDLG